MADQVGALGSLMAFDELQVLHYRSDTKRPLSAVSDRYQVVQPREVLEFYRDLIEVSGYELETAGVLRDGRKFWALVRTGKESLLAGNDLMRCYLPGHLLRWHVGDHGDSTSIRVVCSNTLALAIGRAEGAVKVSHRTSFDPLTVKR
ncbi:MAG: DUF932 domain-containing protein [Inhella sp.]